MHKLTHCEQEICCYSDIRYTYFDLHKHEFLLLLTLLCPNSVLVILLGLLLTVDVAVMLWLLFLVLCQTTDGHHH